MTMCVGEDYTGAIHPNTDNGGGCVCCLGWVGTPPPPPPDEADNERTWIGFIRITFGIERDSSGGNMGWFRVSTTGREGHGGSG